VPASGHLALDTMRAKEVTMGNSATSAAPPVTLVPGERMPVLEVEPNNSAGLSMDLAYLLRSKDGKAVREGTVRLVASVSNDGDIVASRLREDTGASLGHIGTVDFEAEVYEDEGRIVVYATRRGSGDPGVEAVFRVHFTGMSSEQFQWAF
jgi:hypothetical protein